MISEMFLCMICRLSPKQINIILSCKDQESLISILITVLQAMKGQEFKINSLKQVRCDNSFAFKIMAVAGANQLVRAAHAI